MRSAHVAFFTVPQPVHVNPTLSTVSVLVRRGHRVSYVTSERYSSDVRALGAKVILCPRLEYPRTQRELGSSLPMSEQYATGIVDLSERSFSAVMPILESDTPDLIVFDTHSFAGILVANALGITSVRVTSHLRKDEEDTFSRNEVENFFTNHQLYGRNIPLTTAKETIYLYHESLQLGQHDAEDSHYYAPRCAAERPYNSSLENSDKCRDSVLVSCSTYYVEGRDYFSRCVEAIRLTGRPSLLALLPQMESSALGDIPDNCRVLRDAPLLEAMKLADVIVCQGGTATTMEAMYHGLPMVMISNGHKQIEMYADNVARHRLGVHIRKSDTTADNIAQAIQEVRSEPIISSVNNMRRMIIGGHGAENVATRIEGHL